ncbi:MAG: FAD-binding oxidoreductase, partial [Alphaproteobacteria bacterium]
MANHGLTGGSSETGGASETGGVSELARKLRAAVEGEVMFDRFSRGRYAVDASIYQIMPIGVVVPRTIDDVIATMDVARDAGVPILPRGGGTSQCGQTVNDAIVLDLSRHLNRIVEIDVEAATAVVEPGLVLDTLNAALEPYGLWYPVDVSTSSRATLGGMTANNSCGARSIRYGTSRDNVLAIDAILADGTRARFDEIDPAAFCAANAPASGNPLAKLIRDLLDLGAREADEIRARFPQVPRRVGGYNIDALIPDGPVNLAHLLVGSEGTLAFSERITLKLAPLPTHKVLGVCHFPDFQAAMEATQHLVTLEPTAVELFDRKMLDLSRAITMFRPLVKRFVRGEPEALLVVEFAEPDRKENLRRLKALGDMMAELGFCWDDPGKRPGGVVEAIDPGLQKDIIEVRKQGLNIMMSMKSTGKPVSFIEDCCVALPDLAAYTDRLSQIFRKYDVDATFYAHASVGTLHVRPVLNLKQDAEVKKLRAIAEETFAIVREYKGSHSGEHGDGIVRSEFHTPMFGERIVAAFEAVKARMDPGGLFNPGRIVHAPKMDDRRLFRYRPDYCVPEMDTVFDWPGHIGAGRGFQGAVEMCNNNGACRKLSDGVMCPSWRVTRNERDLVRGRANTLRLAISGQLGADAMISDAMAETMALCVSCKGCRRECPTGVDMAKMKIEVLAARVRHRGITLRDRLVAYLPRYAPYARALAPLLNLRDRLPGLPWLSERLLGFSASRPLPKWRFDIYHPAAVDPDPDVILFADTFNRYHEPENLHAAEHVLRRAGLRVGHAGTAGGRPICCGRTFLAVGLAEEARAELRRAIGAIAPALARGAHVVGLEPSCLLTFRDEAPALLGDEWTPEMGARVMLFEEYLAMKLDQGLRLPLGPLATRTALVHGHCHQKAFNLFGPLQHVLQLIPELKVEAIPSSCCGMAGAFGYQAETAEISRRMGELGLLPRVRSATAETIIVADGVSCRHQIADGTGREA